MNLNQLIKMVSALKNDKQNVSNFRSNPVAFIEKFLGVDLPDDQVNALIAGVSSNFLKGDNASDGGLGSLLDSLLGGGARENASAVDKQGIDFSALIGKLTVAKFDTNGDGKLDMNDLSDVLGNILGGGKASFKADTQAQEPSLDLGTLLKTFKI